MKKDTNFKDTLENKKSILILILLMVLPIFLGITILALVYSKENIQDCILPLLCIWSGYLPFLYSLSVINKSLKHPEKLTVYDSYVVYKRIVNPTTKQAGSNILFVKKDNGKNFKLTVFDDDYKKYDKNSRILAIKSFCIGGILVTEEDCQKYGFKRIYINN